jgi:cytochrome P450
LPFFSPGRVNNLEPVTRAIVGDLLDRLDGREEFDASQELTKPLPMKVTERLLGTPAEDADRFSGWTHDIVESGAQDHERAVAAAVEMAQYLAGLMEQRRAEPADDLVTFMATAQPAEDEPTLDESERLGCLFLLLIAGIDTTWSALSSTLWHLARTPEHRQMLTEEPSRLPAAVEEFLRAFAPTTVARVVAQETEIDGHHLCPGDQLLVPFPAANRDPTEFPDPEDVILDRQPNRHLAFGIGAHHCLGAGLARMEMRVALEELLARVTELSLVDEAAVPWKTGPMRGPSSLPVRVRWH